MNKSKYKLLQWQNWKICTSQITAFTGTEAQSDANFPATQQTHIAGKTSLWLKQSVGWARKQDCVRKVGSQTPGSAF